MKKWLLLIMNSEPAIVEIAQFDSIKEAKTDADHFVFINNCEYESSKWLGESDYPYRIAISHDSVSIGERFGIEIMPSSKIESKRKV